MTSAQLILVSVTSALVAVFAMLLVATIKRARARDSLSETTPSEETASEGTEKREKEEPG